eukprot:gene4708-5156_t
MTQLDLQPATEQKWRAKLYELESTGSWLDQGTGYVTLVMNSTTLHCPALVMVSEEEDGKVLLESKIQSDEQYEKQGESLILWKEEGYSANIDYALSFQDLEGCSAIWTAIRSVQAQYSQHREFGSTPSFTRTQCVGADHTHNALELENSFHVLPTDMTDPNILQKIKMKLDNLHPSQKDYISAQLIDENCVYLQRVFEKFVILEQKEDVQELRLLADVMRGIMLLNDPTIIEYLLSDEAFAFVAGIFEYDRTLRERGSYRTFFRQAVRQQVISLSQEMQSASAFLFRVRYVRDIMLHPTIDEPGVTAINSMITFTSAEICYQVLTDCNCMKELFAVILHPVRTTSVAPCKPRTPQEGTPTETDVGAADPVISSSFARSIDGLRFLRELITLSKFVVLEKRVEFYKTFLNNCREDFFEVFRYVFSRASFGLRARKVTSVGSVIENEKKSNNLGITYTRTRSGRILLAHEFDKSHSCSNSNAHNSSFQSPSNFDVSLSSTELPEALAIAAEVLAAFVCICPTTIRQEILESSKPAWSPAVDYVEGRDCSWMKTNLLFLIIDMIINAHDAASIDQLGDCLKAILDFEKPGSLKSDKDRFLPVFYEFYAVWIMVPFLERNDPSQPVSHGFYFDKGMRYLEICKEYDNLQPSSALIASRRVLFELLNLCVATHSYRAKYFLIRSNYINRLVSKTFSNLKYRHLHLYAVKFLRAIIGLKDEFYFRHIEKLDVFRPVLTLLKSYSTQDNLITSSIHDLLEVIRIENISTLIIYVVEKFGDCFGDRLHTKALDGLEIRYNQMRDRERYREGGFADKVAGAPSSGNGSSFGGNRSDRQGIRSKLGLPISAAAFSENRRLREIDREDSYFFADDEDEPTPIYKNGSSLHAIVASGLETNDKSSSSIATEDGSLSPGFLDSLRHKLVPAKPASPPHYSHWMHGSPLDGDIPPSSVSSTPSLSHSPIHNGNHQHDEHDGNHQHDETSTDENAQPRLLTNPKLLSLISIYGDEEELSNCTDVCKVDEGSSPEAPLPPLRSKFTSEDEDDNENAFLAKRLKVDHRTMPSNKESTRGSGSGSASKTRRLAFSFAEDRRPIS